jgi:hypothetical protein
MTVYKWQVAGVVDDPLQGSRKSYGLPPIEWFSHLRPGKGKDMSLEDVLFLGQTRTELLAALEDNLSIDPILDEMSEIFVEAVNTGCSLYRMDYHDGEIRLFQIADVLIE